MSARPLLSRRRFLFLATLLGGAQALAGEDGKGSGDNGIGGTGYRPGDNGIGGTGFVGVIRKFGSVYVNGQRIAFPDDATIEIDGARVEARDMRLGQVARLVAQRSGKDWTTSRIVIVSEVIGPVERIAGKRIDVLGQRVDLPNRRIARALKIGDRIAVSGLRRPDQIIVTSAIERREGGLDQIAGVLSREADGAARIGGQTVAGVGDAPTGQRIVVRGGVENGVFIARDAQRDADIAIAGVKDVSIETWVSRRDGVLVTAGGVKVEDRSGTLPSGSRPVVIDGELSPGGFLIARKIEFGSSRGGFDPTGGPGGGGPFGGTGGPGGSNGGPFGGRHGGGLPGAAGGPPGGGPPGGPVGGPFGGPPGGPGGLGGVPGGGGAPNWLGGGLPEGGAPPIGGPGALGGGVPPFAPGGGPLGPGGAPPWGGGPPGGPGGIVGPPGFGGRPGGPRIR